MTSNASHQRTTSSTSDDWSPGEVVDHFTPTKQPSELPDWDQWEDFAQPSSSASPLAPPGKVTSPPPPSSSATGQIHNQADDDFFAALERSSASTARHRQPPPSLPPPSQHLPASSASSSSSLPPRSHSPPVIDLREEQRRIAERNRNLQLRGILGKPDSNGNNMNKDDDDWFAAFERNNSDTTRKVVSAQKPASNASSSSRPAFHRDNSANLATDQLDSIREARDSPLPPPTPIRSSTDVDYFTQPTASALAAPRQPRRSATTASTSSSTAPAPAQSSASWWGSLRHLGSDLASRAADYLDPGVDFGDEELKIARKMGAIDLNSREVTPAGTPTATSRSATPTLGGRKPSASMQQLHKKATETAAAASSAQPVPPSSKLISGAPGVDFSNLHPHWNTGSWSLAADDPSKATAPSDPILRSEKEVSEALGGGPGVSSRGPTRPRHLNPLPVSLVGRYEDSSPVITSFHSSHIQPYLPPRLKLGRTWKLLYSSDQHGVSLETLYDRVKRGMDEKPGSSGTKNGPAGSDWNSLESRQDGWLRGASASTREALGSGSSSSASAGATSSSSRPSRLGSGLTSMSDAGLVLAVRDADDNVFGAFTNERLRKGHRGYYGSGEGFLFRQILSVSRSAKAKAKARAGKAQTSTLAPFSDPYVRIYPSTALNTFHALSEPGYLAFGGSSASYQAAAKAKRQQREKSSKSSSSSTTKTSYGLWLDDSFSSGVSGTCETYKNPPLCDSLERVGDVVSILGQQRQDGTGWQNAGTRRSNTLNGNNDVEDDEEEEEEEEEEAETIEGSFEPVVVEVWAVGLD